MRRKEEVKMYSQSMTSKCKVIALRLAVELSYLSEEEQSDLYETIKSEDCTPSYAQATKLRKLSE